MLSGDIQTLLENYAARHDTSFSSVLQRAAWELLYREEYRVERYEVETDFGRGLEEFDSLREQSKARAEGIHFGSITLRTSKQQKQLVDYAARRSRLSIQKLIEHIIFSEIEETFGADFDEYRMTRET